MRREQMKYLSFDIECCDGKHICEFGYVITDENFNTLQKVCLTINPEKPFNLTGRKNKKDCILAFSEEEYSKSPTFPEYYDTIKTLISAPNTIIFGHSMSNDAAFLRTACRRYNLPPLNFKFVDSQVLYKEFSGKTSRISLENAEDIFNLDNVHQHKSDEDALATIKLVESICKAMEVSVSELISLCSNACGESKNFNIQYKGKDLQSMLNDLNSACYLSKTRRKQCIQEFVDIVLPQTAIIESCLNNKKICFSPQFEISNTAETIKLIQILANHGCQYNMKVLENDYYVASDEELTNPTPQEHSRYHIAVNSTNPKRIKVMSLDEFLSILNISPETLATLEMPKVPKHVKEKTNVYSVGKASNTLGDKLLAQGIDLTKLFVD